MPSDTVKVYSEKRLGKVQKKVDRWKSKAATLQTKMADRRAEKPFAQMAGKSAKIGKFGRKIAKASNKYGVS